MRKELAAARRVPAYLVFHDAVLREIAAARPSDLDELGAIPGLGPRKLADFGAAVLAAVRDGAPEGARRDATAPALIRARDV
jgi:ATP-dependent DNA helicase RecQ